MKLVQEAYIALLSTASALERDFTELLKPHDLSGAQYNVQRNLRGAGPEGETCGEVGGRLIRHDPDVTRLLDRLEKRGLIARGRDTRDRRIVRTRITDTGLELLTTLDEVIDAVHEKQLGHMSEAELRRLIATMGAVSGG
jgi:DNA-binding MarR family transcriptional regulator